MIRKISLILLAVYLTGSAAQAQQRGGGGRGPAPNAGDNPLALLAPLDRLNRTFSAGGAWWTNAALVARLGITEDQKTRVERVFENHRANLESSRAVLEKEETQLAQLLNAEPFDRNAALTQTYRVIQARSDMERENALMTLEMREQLTRDQWMQLPQPGVALYYTEPRFRLRIPEGGGGRGERGQQ